MLINHCATSGCHGPQSETGLRLLRSSGGKTAGRRITQRNLYSVLQFIDRENPMASRLLTATSGPHGTARYAIFSERQALQYKHLVDWANQVACVSVSESPIAAFPAPAPAASTAPDAAPQALSADARRARPLAAAEKTAAARRNAARPASKPAGDAATPASYNQPADPFDPEAFNRQFAPKDKEKPPAEAKLLSPQ